MLTWLAPFVVAAVLGLLYFLPATRPAMAKNINTGMGAVVATAAVSMLSNWNDQVNWLDWLAWIVAGASVALLVTKSRSPSNPG